MLINLFIIILVNLNNRKMRVYVNDSCSYIGRFIDRHWPAPWPANFQGEKKNAVANYNMQMIFLNEKNLKN